MAKQNITAANGLNAYLDDVDANHALLGILLGDTQVSQTVDATFLRALKAIIELQLSRMNS